MVDDGMKAVERAVSQQAQYSRVGVPAPAFGTFLRWADASIPDYKPDSRKLDRWLVDFVYREPHLNGVVNQAVSLVRNRGWSLTGGRNQVRRVKAMLHDADKPEIGRGGGYRQYITKGARAFYTTNMGMVNENGRDGEVIVRDDGEPIVPPLRALWSADPTRFRLTGLPQKPLAYYPRGGRMAEWGPYDFFRVVANQSFLEEFNGLGMAPALACVELAKIMVAIYRYDQEQLGARAPQGLLLLQGISQEQWNSAMEARDEELTGKEREYFSGVAVLASAGMEQLEAKLVALSQLPSGFDRRGFVDLLMYLYALVFNFPPDEFWPVRGGSFGRGEEAQIQLQRATRKGDADFFTQFQEKLQQELPASVLFEFDERDDKGRLVEAQVAQAWADVARTLYETGLNVGAPLLPREQALSLLVDHGVIPPEYTEAIEETQAEDVGLARLRRWRARAKEMDQVWRAAALFPDESIVRYQYPADRTVVLWESAEELLRPGTWQGHGAGVAVQRQTVLFEGDGVVITTEDVDRAVEEARERVGDELADALVNKPLTDEEMDGIESQAGGG